MIRYILITYSILFYSPLFGQQNISGRLTDEFGNSIPFATVCDAFGNGVVCSELGNFNLPLTDSLSRYIIVSAVGYNTDTLIIAANITTYQLSSKNYKLNEIAILSHQNIDSKSSVSAFTAEKKEILTLRPRNVSEVLQTKAGFTNKSGYQTPLCLRGMSGKRLLVLRNGIRRFSSYPAGYMSHTINVYDLERIEVEKGAASVIYGAGAMAGIINLIDKSPFKQEGVNAKITTGYGSVNHEKSLLTCGGWSDGKLAVKSGFRYRDAQNFKYPDNSIAENSFYTDKDLFVTAGYQFSEKQKLIFTSDFHDGGPWGKPLGFNGTNYMRVQTKNEKSNNYALKYHHATAGIVRNFETNLFYSKESREMAKNYYTAAGYSLSYVETTYFSDYYYGANINALVNVTPNYQIKTGVEAYSFHISTPIDVIDYIDEISFTNRISENAHNLNFGAYVENNIRLTPKVKAVAGIRYNKATINQGNVHSSEQSEGLEQQKEALSGNVAIIYRIKKYSTLKFNLARSFRMPETTELFTDSYTSNGIIYGNSELKPEYCNSIDLSYHFSNMHFEFEVSPFLWLMNNMISKEEISGLPGTNFTYVNIGKTRLFGGEINGKLKFDRVLRNNDNFSIQCGISYLNGTDVSESEDYLSNGTPLNYVPPFNVKGDINYSRMFTRNMKCSFKLRTTYYSEQSRLGDNPYATPAYLVLGCNWGVSLPNLISKPSLNVVVNNLTNTEYQCYQSYLPSEGRDIRVFLSFTF